MTTFRTRRHANMLQLFSALPRPLNILDVGGTLPYWQTYGAPQGSTITLFNMRPQSVAPGFVSVCGDACDLSRYADRQFDVVFSNSVIEHVGDAPRQAAMAREIARVGTYFFVQAPYRHFPVEVHFRMPFFQYWPRCAQKLWCRLRYRGAQQTRALADLNEIRLPTFREFREWFPRATVAALLVSLPVTAYAQEDLTPPTLLDMRFEPETIDTSSGPQTITVTVHVTDDLSGVEWVAIGFGKEGTTQHAGINIVPGYDSTTLLAGDNRDGYYRSTMTLPQYSAYGAWEMTAVALVDNVGNRIQLTKPTDSEQKKGATEEQWPSLFNGFAFSVGVASDAPAYSLFLPSVAP